MSRSAPEPVAPSVDARAESITELGVAFRHAFRSLRSLRGRDTHLVDGELGHAQFELLLELYERGALSAGDLATAAALSPATISPMLDYLADIGLVERERSQTDRRVVVTKLTSSGARRIEAHKALWRARWSEALADVDPADLRIAADVLHRIGSVFSDES